MDEFATFQDLPAQQCHEVARLMAMWWPSTNDDLLFLYLAGISVVMHLLGDSRLTHRDIDDA